jgi:hypothetical protein
MVEGQASDLYASDTDTWSATSSVQGSGKEPAESSHSPPDPTVIRSHPSEGDGEGWQEEGVIPWTTFCEQR